MFFDAGDPANAFFPGGAVQRVSEKRSASGEWEEHLCAQTQALGKDRALIEARGALRILPAASSIELRFCLKTVRRGHEQRKIHDQTQVLR